MTGATAPTSDVWCTNGCSRPRTASYKGGFARSDSGDEGRHHRGSATSVQTAKVGRTLADLHPGLRISPDKPGYRPRVTDYQLAWDVRGRCDHSRRSRRRRKRPMSMGTRPNCLAREAQSRAPASVSRGTEVRARIGRLKYARTPLSLADDFNASTAKCDQDSRRRSSLSARTSRPRIASARSRLRPLGACGGSITIDRRRTSASSGDRLATP